MRFGRRAKTRLFPGRRDASAPDDSSIGPVASEERSALLFQPPETVEETEPVEEDATPGQGDPTQRLLTALGRFHRFVAKGQAGAPQEFWTDECMNQLAAAAETSLAQNWTHIVDAITGTARVLHSYENAGSAHLCTSFLNDSYEILCLMVSDLIVNKVRAGVVNKWRERYDRAIDELTAAGLTLIEDDVQSESRSPEPAEPEPPVRASTPEILPFEFEERATEGESGPARDVAALEEPSLDNFLDGIDKTKRAIEEPSRVSESVFEEEPAIVAPPSPPAEVKTVGGTQAAPEVVSVLDELCEDFAQLEHAPESERSDRFDSMSANVLWLQDYARSNDQPAAAEVCQRMRSLSEQAIREKRTLDDRFFDIAYAFCEVYVAAQQDPENLFIKSWSGDVQTLSAAWASEAKPRATAAAKTAATVPPPAETPPPAAVPLETPIPDESSPESLLQTAQRAIASGDMAVAKNLALQAVVHLASVEMAKAEKRVQEAEARFSENAEAIERARAQAKKAEQDVLVAEGRVAEGQALLADMRAHSAVVVEKLQGLERKISDIDEQIRALQAAREAEQQRAAETQRELDNARIEEREAESTIESLGEAERAARAQLESARQAVKEHQRRRLDLEEALSRARETLMHHRTSLGDIEHTITQLQPEKPQPPESEGLLF